MVVLNRPKYGQTQKQNVGSKEKAQRKDKREIKNNTLQNKEIFGPIIIQIL